MKLLLAVDGSAISTRAAKFATKLASQLATPPKVILFHADPPMLQSVAVKLGMDTVQRLHAENGEHALRPARAVLKRAKLNFSERLMIGEPAISIVEVAAKERCALIVMGSHGHTALQRLLLGSVASKVIAESAIPVTVVR